MQHSHVSNRSVS